MTSEVLRPCPFCGSEWVELVPGEWRDEIARHLNQEFSVVCHNCSSATGHSPDKRVVINRWNSRSTQVVGYIHPLDVGRNCSISAKRLSDEQLQVFIARDRK